MPNDLEKLLEFSQNIDNPKKEEKEIKSKRENLERLAEMAMVNEAVNEIKPKSYNDSFLYHEGNYEKHIFEFLMKADEIEKSNPSFKDIKYMVQRQQYQFLANILDSDLIVLLSKRLNMPRSFKVFAAKDVRHGTGQLKVYIDVTDIIKIEATTYTLQSSKLNELVSYLTSAMVYGIYQKEPSKLLRNTNLIEHGTKCFALLFSHVIDYLRMGGVDNIREKSLYLSSLYYQKCLLGDIYSDNIVRNTTISPEKDSTSRLSGFLPSGMHSSASQPGYRPEDPSASPSLSAEPPPEKRSGPVSAGPLEYTCS